jgi:hypothetical protein
MSRDKSGIACGHGVMQSRDAAGHFFRGPSKIRHYFDPNNEADRRAGILAAQSAYGPLPSGCALSLTAENCLRITARGKEFTLLTDNPWAYGHARRQIHEHLKQTRTKHEQPATLFTKAR